MSQRSVRPAPARLAMRRATAPGRRHALALLVVALACAGPRAVPGRGAEERIAPADVGDDVAWLADPARTGRGVGTPGNDEAARWIAARMRQLGLAPAGSDGYLQSFEAPVGARLAGENALRVGGHDLAVSVGWQPFTFSDDGVIEGALVWVGHGITAPDLGHDDYAGVDVKGKIVLVAAHAPGEKDEKSPWRDPQRYHYGEWRYKAANARDHGAAAVIAVRDAWNHPGPDGLEPWRGVVSSRAGIVAARVTSEALSGAGIDALALAGEGDRPGSRALAQRARLSVHVVHETARTSNVLGALPGSDPRAGCVVVGAHFDHLGLGGETSLAPGAHEVHPGADDNASGVAAMLAIARAMQQDRPLRTVVFAAFSGEELGLLGSAQVVRAPPPSCPVDAMQLMVNLDMVGRPQGGKLYVQGTGTAVGERDRIAALAAEAPPIPLTLAFGGDDGYGPSDHTSFHAQGVPIVFFFTGAHADYHRPSDTADKIDPRGLASVARLAYRTARAAADAPERYVAVRTAPPPGSQATAGERSAGYGAYLGSIPDFGERKERGVLVSAVRPGSPAEAVGVRGGDVLLSLGAAQLASLQDLAYALRSHRPGDRVELVWQRGGDTLRANVTLAERK